MDSLYHGVHSSLNVYHVITPKAVACQPGVFLYYCISIKFNMFVTVRECHGSYEWILFKMYQGYENDKV